MSKKRRNRTTTIKMLVGRIRGVTQFKRPATGNRAKFSEVENIHWVEPYLTSKTSYYIGYKILHILLSTRCGAQCALPYISIR